jgi:mevalonate kinase
MYFLLQSPRHPLCGCCSGGGGGGGRVVTLCDNSDRDKKCKAAP